MSGEREKYSGLWAFLTTPFDDGRVATDTLLRMTRDAGAHGYAVICVAGAIGEGSRLSADEASVMASTVVRSTGRVSRVVSTLYEGDGLIEATIAARESGVDAVLLVPRSSELPHIALRAIRQVADGLPVFLYNVAPLRLEPASLEELLTIGNVIGVKDGHGDLRAFRQLREAHPHLVTVAAWEDLVLPYWALGADAYAPASAAYAPWYAPQWFAALQANDAARARDVLRTHAFPLSDLRRSRPGLELAVVRAASERLGIALGPSRGHLEELTPAEERRLIEVLVSLEQFRLSGGPPTGHRRDIRSNVPDSATGPDPRATSEAAFSPTLTLGHAPALPLIGVFGDPSMAVILAKGAYVDAWREVETALVLAAADVDLIPLAEARQVASDISMAPIDLVKLDQDTIHVGYPILPLLSQLVAASGPSTSRYLHWGATTQDIMDTGLVLVLRRAVDRIRGLITEVGDHLSNLAQIHRVTPITARTHAQPAVPTTFGAKVAVWLAEFTRHIERLEAAEAGLLFVSLHGAGGTAAALGSAAPRVRAQLAKRLDLKSRDIPWHSSRDGLAELSFVLAACAATAGRIAREVIDLARPEIGELSERAGHLRGASSTMPQKANPITCEVIVGMSYVATAQLDAVLSATRVEHERSAGEWQVEWDVLPILVAATSGALTNLAGLTETLVVHEDRMAANLDRDGGTVMAEAVMMALAPTVGRDRAHGLVYEASVISRRQAISLRAAVAQVAKSEELTVPEELDRAFDPMGYLGEAPTQADAAVRAWRSRSQAGRHREVGGVPGGQ